MNMLQAANYWNNEYLEEVKKGLAIENRVEEVNNMQLAENATDEEKKLLEKIKTILRIEFKTKKDIGYFPYQARKKYIVPKGSKVLKDSKSPTGYYLSSDVFDTNSEEHRHARDYGLCVNKKDIE